MLYHQYKFWYVHIMEYYALSINKCAVVLCLDGEKLLRYIIKWKKQGIEQCI